MRSIVPWILFLAIALQGPQLKAQFFQPDAGAHFSRADSLRRQGLWDSAYAEAKRKCDSLLSTQTRSDSLLALGGWKLLCDIRTGEAYFCDALHTSGVVFALARHLQLPLEQAEVFRVRAGLFRESLNRSQYCSGWLQRLPAAGRFEYRYFNIDAVSNDSSNWLVRATAGGKDLIDTLALAEVIAMAAVPGSERKGETIGTAKLRWKNQVYSGWEVQHREENDTNLLVRAGDQLRLRVQVAENTDGSNLLSPILYNNIRLTDAEKNLMIDPFEVCDTLLKHASASMVAAFTASVADVWTRFQHSDEQTLARFRVPIRSGLFGGQTILEVVQHPKPVYIRAFLTFMKDNTGMYAGQEFRFSEVYATWMLYGAPLRARPLADLFASLEVAELSETLPKFDSLIDAGGYDREWCNYGAELVEAEKFGESRKLERVLHTTAAILNKDLLRAHAHYIRAYRNEYYGQPDSAAYYYHRAASIYEKAGRMDDKITMEGCIANLTNTRSLRVQVQSGHQLGFTLRFSPDGTRYATGGVERLVKVWDTRSGMELFALEGHQAEIMSIEWSRDGKRLISADKDGNLHVWDLGTRRLVLSRYFEEGIRSIHLSPDGDLIAVLPFAKEVYLLKSSGLEVRFVLRGHERNVQNAQFVPGKRILFTAGNDKKLIRWNLDNGNSLETIDLPARCGEFIYNPVYSFLGAICADSGIHFWQIGYPDGMKYLGRFGNHQIRAGYMNGDTIIFVSPAVFSADGRLLFFRRDGAHLTVYNIRTDREKTYDAFGEFIKEFELSQDGNTLAAVGRFGALYLTDLSRFDYYNATNLDIQQVEFPAAGIAATCLVPAGGRLWLGSSTDQSRLLDLGTGKSRAMPESYDNGTGRIFTADGKRYVTFRYKESVLMAELRSLESDSVVKRLPVDHRKPFACLAPDGSSIALLNEQGSQLEIVDFNGDTLLRFALKKTLSGGVYGSTLAYSSDSRFLVASMGKALYRFALDGSSSTQRLRIPNKTNFIRTVQWQGKDAILYSAAENKLEFRDFQNFRSLRRPIALPEGIMTAMLSADGKKVFTSDYSGRIRSIPLDNPKQVTDTFRAGRGCWFMDLSSDGKTLLVADFESAYLLSTDNLKIQARVIPMKGREPVILDAENHYFAPVRSLVGVAFEYRRKFFPPEQFDLNYNRPDLVLSSIQRADSNLVSAYRKAWEKRVQRSGVDTALLQSEFSEMPELRLVNPKSIPLVTTVRKLEFQMRFQDKQHNVERLIIWINGVPVSGSRGWTLPYSRKEDLLSVWVPLDPGENKIQAAVENKAGIRSLRETFYIRYDPQVNVKPNLHVVVMSVSSYSDSAMDLKYAVKDGRDLVNLFAGDSSMRERYGSIHVDTLFNRQATREQFAELRRRMLKTETDDHVVLYVSGHGLLDKDYNFWYATHDMDFSNPGSRGIAYEDLEGLLDGIPARKRLFLIDACHSGEVDKDDLLAIDQATCDSLVLGTRGGRTVNTARRSEQLGSINAFELMKEMFADAGGTGASVIAASAGTSFALESDEWRNGIFTYALLHGLRDLAADLNNDGNVSINELNAYVTGEVHLRTRGLQKPAARRLDPRNDWIIR